MFQAAVIGLLLAILASLHPGLWHVLEIGWDVVGIYFAVMTALGILCVVCYFLFATKPGPYLLVAILVVGFYAIQTHGEGISARYQYWKYCGTAADVQAHEGFCQKLHDLF
jgi:hypothetical protein